MRGGRRKQDVGRGGAATGCAWCGGREGDVWTGDDESQRGERRGHQRKGADGSDDGKIIK